MHLDIPISMVLVRQHTEADRGEAVEEPCGEVVGRSEEREVLEEGRGQPGRSEPVLHWSARR